MSRSFLMAVSAFAILAACSPREDVVVVDEDDDIAAETDSGLLADDENLDSSTASVDGYLDAETEVSSDLGDYESDMLADSLDDGMTDDGEGSLTGNPDAAADEMADSHMSDFNTDFAGIWGTSAQCSDSGSTWAISETLISTPGDVVCTVTNIDEGAGQAEITATCSGETADGETMADSEQTFMLAAQDDGRITINHRTEETVERCL